MKATAFDYAQPKDVGEALQLLREDGTRAAAGTQSLGPMLNLRVVQPALLVDLRGIEELRSASEDKDNVTLGACVTHAEIEDRRVPDATRGFMPAIAAHIAYRAVRNRGTIGGSLAHADPAADWPTALMLLRAVALIAGPEGRREVPIERFVTGLFETSLAPGELLVGVRVPRLSARGRTGYWKFCRKAGEFPQSIGAALDDPERGVHRAVIGANGGAPRLIPEAQALLRGNRAACFAAVDAAGLGADAYDRQLRAVALHRAVARLAA